MEFGVVKDENEDESENNNPEELVCAGYVAVEREACRKEVPVSLMWLKVGRLGEFAMFAFLEGTYDIHPNPNVGLVE